MANLEAARAELKSVIDLKHSADRWEARAEEIRATLYGTSAIAYDKPSVQTSVSGDQMADKVAKLIEWEDKAEQKKKELCLLRCEITARIDRMKTDRYKQLLYLRYVECLPWRNLAKQMYVSVDYARRALHTSAIAEYADMMYGE